MLLWIQPGVPLPEEELTVLQKTTSRAELLGARGDEIAGRRQLLEGLRRARRAWKTGAPWAPALFREYHQALARFQARFREGLLARSRHAETAARS
jgi:hypothetical protein